MKKNEAYTQPELEIEHGERVLNPQTNAPAKRKFPTVGGEPQGKTPHEMATSFPME